MHGIFNEKRIQRRKTRALETSFVIAASKSSVPERNENGSVRRKLKILSVSKIRISIKETGK